MTKKFIAAFAVAIFAFNASAATFNGMVTEATGAVASLLTAGGSIPLPVPLTGEVTFDGTGAVDLLVTQVVAFFFTNDWTGGCNMSPPAVDCMYGAHPLNPDPMSAVFSEVPITSITMNTLVLDVNDIPVSGVLAFDAFSPTFGFSLGIITLDVDTGTFNLNSGALGGASGTLEFQQVPVPAAVWLFGSALLGLFGARRRS